MRLHFPKVRLHVGVVALFAIVLQAAAIFAPLGYDDVPKRLLFQISYILLIFFVAANWRRLGILIIGIGLTLNFAAIVANGGLMPVTPEALVRIGESDKIRGLEEGDAIPYQKEVLKSRENTHLWVLTDRLVWNNPVFFRVFSVGDVIIAGGLIVTLGDLLLPRVRREPENGPSPEATG